MGMHRNQSPFAGGEGGSLAPKTIALRTEIPEGERKILAGADSRIQWTMHTVGAIGSLALAIWQGMDWAAGFAMGAGLSILNFHWLSSAVNVIATAMRDQTSGQAAAAGPAAKPARPRTTIARFVFRYALIGLAGYAIFLVSASSLKAFLLGLLVLVAGLMAEALYQAFEAIFSSHTDGR